MHKFNCNFTDNSGKRQIFTITAKDKQSAIDKAFIKARKNAKGDFISWDVKLIF